MQNQRTIKKEIKCSGIGLHSGRKVNLCIKPAHADNGVTFIRKDLEDAVIGCTYKNVSHLNYATSLKQGEATISTVEHLLAAAAGLGIDNLEIEVDAPEIPIFDGSAAPYIYLFREAGFRTQRKSRKTVVLKSELHVAMNGGSVSVYPSDDYKISYMIDFNHPILSRQERSLVISSSVFINEISGARTFGFLKDVEMLRKQGLAKGGSLDNAIVIGEKSVLNKSLRFKDEFVRHKILDAMGDFALMGAAFRGHIVARKAGHALHAQMVKQIMETAGAWEYEAAESRKKDEASEPALSTVSAASR